jgi:hypothetical protein
MRIIGKPSKIGREERGSYDCGTVVLHGYLWFFQGGVELQRV